MVAVSGPPPSRRAKVAIYRFADWPRVAPCWLRLAETSPYTSFYLSESWIGAWLQVFGERLNPEILLFEGNGDPVGACLLVPSTEQRGPFQVRRVYLNTGGEGPADRIMMEFNNVLCLPGWEREVAATLGGVLSARQWDEFAAEGVSPSPVLGWLEAEASLKGSWSKTTRDSFYVDLARLRQSTMPYENSLSANTRQQLRRSLKLCGLQGTLRTEIAPELSSAQAMFDELIELHQRTWLARGQPGAFASPRRVEFFRALICRAFPDGAIQMVRVAVGRVTIGVLFNFVQKGKVYFFQGGLNYEQQRHLKPGFVTHACAIRYCLEHGLDEYDFLAGEAQYKRSLSTDQRPLAWMVLARPRLKLALIARLRSLKRVVKKGARKRAGG